MDKKQFDKIIDFAVKREKDAILFYNDLRDRDSFRKHRDLLDTLVEMEKVHIDVLESLRVKTMKHVLLPRIENMDTRDYNPSPVLTPDMSYEDILYMAISREEESFQLYTKLARGCLEPDIKKLFLRLAAEEVGHKTQFERLVDGL